MRPEERVPPVSGTTPAWLLVLATAGLAFLVLPLVALALHARWSVLTSQLSDSAARQALSLSLRTATAATACCLLAGVPLAVVLARGRSRFRPLLKGLVTLPLVMPPVVSGLCLLFLFGRLGLLGRPLAHWGVTIGFTQAAVILAQTFVSLPFLTLSVESALRAVDRRYEATAAGLGASPTRVFWTVTVPMVRPAIVSGAAVAFARSLGEYGATVTFAGSAPGVTRTLPSQIYLAITSTGADSAVGMSLILVAVALGMLVLVWRSGS